MTCIIYLDVNGRICKTVCGIYCYVGQSKLLQSQTIGNIINYVNKYYPNGRLYDGVIIIFGSVGRFWFDTPDVKIYVFFCY